MILDIFSTFDPTSRSTLLPSLLLCLYSLSLYLMLFSPSNQMNLFPRLTCGQSAPLSTIISQLFRYSSFHLKGLSIIISSIFILIIFTNLLGMGPYLFSPSSHLLMTLSLGLPLWASMILSSFILNPYKSVSHMLPDGAPQWLNPFLVLIETTSVLVRPLTLSFRLAANMTAGHVVLALLSTYTFNSTLSMSSSSLFLIASTSGYIMFEFAICLIQAYIFCLLLSLYSDDHAS